MVALLLAAGGFLFVNPNLVDDVTDVPPDLWPPLPGPFAYVSFIDGRSRAVVQGTAAAVAALLSAGSGGNAQSGEYSPTFSGFAGQVNNAFNASPWRWLRINQTVAVWGEAQVQLNVGPGNGFFEATPPFPFAPGTSANVVANLVALPATPAPEAPVSPFTTALTVGFELQLSGIYPSARVPCSFSFLTT